MINVHVSSVLVRRTSTLRARLCLRTLTSASWTMRASSSAVEDGREIGPPVQMNRAETLVSRRKRSTRDARTSARGALIAGFELQRPQRLHQLAQRKDFALQQVMNLAELVVDLLGCQRPAAAQR